MITSTKWMTIFLLVPCWLLNPLKFQWEKTGVYIFSGIMKQKSLQTYTQGSFLQPSLRFLSGVRELSSIYSISREALESSPITHPMPLHTATHIIDGWGMLKHKAHLMFLSWGYLSPYSAPTYKEPDFKDLAQVTFSRKCLVTIFRLALDIYP